MGSPNKAFQPFDHTERKIVCIFLPGDEAGMLDFMVWPWFERLPLVYKLSVDAHPNLTNWINLMQNEPAVKETALSTENHLKFYEGYRNGQADYDFI